MEAEISAFTRGSATVRYSSITLKRKRSGGAAAQRSSFLTLKHTSSSRAPRSQLTSLHPSLHHGWRDEGFLGGMGVWYWAMEGGFPLFFVSFSDQSE